MQYKIKNLIHDKNVENVRCIAVGKKKEKISEGIQKLISFQLIAAVKTKQLINKNIKICWMKTKVCKIFKNFVWRLNEIKPKKK